MLVKDEHDWVRASSSDSGDYNCKRCGVHANGGPHDGGNYFPGRGVKDPLFFQCRKKIVMVHITPAGPNKRALVGEE